jgi:hypothetical protein
VQEFSAILKSYHLPEVHGDRFGADWVKERFQSPNRMGSLTKDSQRNRSEIFLEFLALLNSCRIELLDHPRLASQLCGLERRSGQVGYERVGHAPGPRRRGQFGRGLSCRSSNGSKLRMLRRSLLIETPEIELQLRTGSGSKTVGFRMVP